SLVRKARDLKWPGRPHLRRWPYPREGHVRQHANDRVRYATQRDAAPYNIQSAAHPLAPEVFRHHRHVRGFFFVRQKRAATDRKHAEQIEIVRCHLAAEDLDRVAEPGERECGRILSREAIEDRLAFAKMLKPRH